MNPILFLHQMQLSTVFLIPSWMKSKNTDSLSIEIILP